MHGVLPFLGEKKEQRGLHSISTQHEGPGSPANPDPGPVPTLGAAAFSAAVSNSSISAAGSNFSISATALTPAAVCELWGRRRTGGGAVSTACRRLRKSDLLAAPQAAVPVAHPTGGVVLERIGSDDPGMFLGLPHGWSSVNPTQGQDHPGTGAERRRRRAGGGGGSA